MKTRIITGIILALSAIIFTLLSPVWLFSLVTLIIMLLAYKEWYSLVIQINGSLQAQDELDEFRFFLKPLLFFIIAAIVNYWIPLMGLLVITLAAIFWAGQVIHILKTRRFQRWFSDFYRYLGAFLLLATWFALIHLHAQGNEGPAMALGAMMVVWVADTGAYFVGQRFGKKPLAPQISPKKTVQGVYGGMLCAAMVSFIYGLWLFDEMSVKLLIWVIASVVAAIVSVVGDLFESYLKRQANVKDSGNLLPGHGGVLDRIDGLIAAIPVFLIVWLILA